MKEKNFNPIELDNLILLIYGNQTHTKINKMSCWELFYYDINKMPIGKLMSEQISKFKFKMRELYSSNRFDGFLFSTKLVIQYRMFEKYGKVISMQNFNKLEDIINIMTKFNEPKNVPDSKNVD